MSAASLEAAPRIPPPVMPVATPPVVHAPPTVASATEAAADLKLINAMLAGTFSDAHLQTVLAIMDAHAANAFIQTNACFVITGIASKDLNARDRLVALGAVDRVMRARRADLDRGQARLALKALGAPV